MDEIECAIFGSKVKRRLLEENYLFCKYNFGKVKNCVCEEYYTAIRRE